MTVPRVGYRLFVAGPAANSLLAQPAWPEPVLPSIAVLPFENMGGDREQDYFVDGIADDIITGLSRIKWLLVIARNSSFPYEGKPWTSGGSGESRRALRARRRRAQGRQSVAR